MIFLAVLEVLFECKKLPIELQVNQLRYICWNFYTLRFLDHEIAVFATETVVEVELFALLIGLLLLGLSKF
jgi:hypothetical protein